MGTIDERGFEAVFNACGAAVLAYLARRTERASAEDALSETFLIAWRRRTELPNEPLPWLYGVARRVLANQVRGDRRRLALQFRLAHDRATGLARLATADPGEAVDEREPISDDVLAALCVLAEADREVLLLDAWEELTRDEAALVLGCRPSAYGVRLHRAKRRFAAAFHAEGTPTPSFSVPSTSTSEFRA